MLLKMCSTKAVEHLVLTETGSDNIGDVEINEWSELLTNEHEIAITRNTPVTLAAITENSRKINGKFKRAAEPITATWNNRNSTKNADSIISSSHRNSDFYVNNKNNSYTSDSLERPLSSPPPKLPPKSSNIINNLNLNGHCNIFNNINGKSFSNHSASINSSDWIELKNTKNPTEILPSASVGGLQRNVVVTTSNTSNNGNVIMRPPPPPPSTAPSQQNLSASSAAHSSRKLSSTSSSSLSSSSMSSSMTLAVTCSPSAKEKCISIRHPHQDLPGTHIQPHSNHHRAMHPSSSTGVSPTSSSSSSSTTVGSSPSGVLQHPMSHSFNSSTLIQTRDCSGTMTEAVEKIGSSASNNVSNNVINNENYKLTTGGASTTILSQLVSSSSSQKILVHQQHPSSITTTTVLSAISSSASGINSYHDKANKNNNATQFVLSNSSSASPSSSACCNDTLTNTNSNCAKEKIIRGKNNAVRHHNHHPLKTPSKNGTHLFMSESKKSPAPQPPILQQPIRPKMILIHQRSLEFNGAEHRVENENDINLEFSAKNVITKQPTKSTSVSRGLQVEEQDLIQFSGHQHQTQNENPSSESPSNNSSSKLIAPNRNNNNNNNGKSPLNKRSEDNGDERLNGNGDNPDNSKGRKDKCDDKKGDRSDVEGVDNNANDCEEDDDEETSSARTADEQMDYLESLEPCPCYAKCCLDSIITLFCVTLLG